LTSIAISSLTEDEVQCGRVFFFRSFLSAFFFTLGSAFRLASARDGVVFLFLRV
jgi:hypothetical protein